MATLYQSELCTIVHGDATDTDVIDAAPTADLLCTDPPYGVKWSSDWSQFPEMAGDDGALDVPTILGAWTRRLRKQRHAYVFGYQPDQLTGPLRLGAATELIWDKRYMSGGFLETPWGKAHEPITFGVHVPSPGDRIRSRGRLSARIRKNSVISVPRIGAGKVNRHPTEKPVALMVQLVESSTMRGDLVCDPFAGSGSTLVAAILTGRRACGVEIDETYAATAVKRVQAAEQIARQIAAI